MRCNGYIMTPLGRSLCEVGRRRWGEDHLKWTLKHKVISSIKVLMKLLMTLKQQTKWFDPFCYILHLKSWWLCARILIWGIFLFHLFSSYIWWCHYDVGTPSFHARLSFVWPCLTFLWLLIDHLVWSQLLSSFEYRLTSV